MTEKAISKSKRGGARPGAGRPPGAVTRNQSQKLARLKLSGQILEALTTLGESLPAIIEEEIKSALTAEDEKERRLCREFLLKFAAQMIPNEIENESPLRGLMGQYNSRPTIVPAYREDNNGDRPDLQHGLNSLSMAADGSSDYIDAEYRVKS